MHMETKNKIGIGLTQFIDFTVKGSSAKTNTVRKIKYQNEYHPAFDYWKQLRDGIIRFHEQELNFDFLEELVRDIDKRKRANYIAALKSYKKFINEKHISWFNPGKANWINDELSVRCSSELGLIINDQPHIIKLYFKGKSEKIDKRNILTTLTLLNSASYEVSHDSQTKHSVLNLQKNSLFGINEVNQDMLIALESEASQFLYIWNKI
jgi:hypothetical protein